MRSLTTVTYKKGDVIFRQARRTCIAPCMYLRGDATRGSGEGQGLHQRARGGVCVPPFASPQHDARSLGVRCYLPSARRAPPNQGDVGD